MEDYPMCPDCNEPLELIKEIRNDVYVMECETCGDRFEVTEDLDV